MTKLKLQTCEYNLGYIYDRLIIVEDVKNYCNHIIRILYFLLLFIFLRFLEFRLQIIRWIPLWGWGVCAGSAS